ncbi:hypothetical protein PARPLA_01886 [Rhodobacteraceae bacterium THAF1]|uniref:hypothetical protein n=1 Tax=Palleronia sp. THAF1 TaxID=2587842 RepID=UPI000F3B1FBC|nr:hypothetical protein [Palleronia sp. THAF1]QFU08979.1 hypothetical protein FIU81_09870 [Palleronia sp. THAF1]VDC24282.1 hypothetical protein PARPLA_01886 [Rhodobacteraceae bacterium THAF1]
MILRLTAIAGVHAAAGVAMGVTGVLAACTVAQTVKRGVEAGSRMAPSGMRPPMTPRQSMDPKPTPMPRDV